MAIDDLLGRDYWLHDGSTIRARLTIIGWCPERGWRLAGAGFSTEWVPRAMFRRLVRDGVLVVA